MKPNLFKDITNKFAIPIVFLIFIVIIQLFNMDKNLLGWSNLVNVLVQASIQGFVSLGLTIILICGEIDMSIAGGLGLIATSFSYSLVNGRSPLESVLIAVAVGLIVWLVYTVLVAIYNFSSIIVGICLMFIGFGAERLINDGITVWINDTNITGVINIEFLGLPIVVVFLIVAYTLVFLLFRYTKFGFQARVIGENPDAAFEVGINPKRIKVLAFLLAFFMYIIASIITPLRLGGAQVYSGNNYLLPSLAACFLGSSMFTPGRVNVLGTFVGSILTGFILKILTIMGVQYFFVQIALGLLLLVSVALSTIRDRSIKQIKV